MLGRQHGQHDCSLSKPLHQACHLRSSSQCALSSAGLFKQLTCRFCAGHRERCCRSRTLHHPCSVSTVMCWYCLHFAQKSRIIWLCPCKGLWVCEHAMPVIKDSHNHMIAVRKLHLHSKGGQRAFDVVSSRIPRYAPKELFIANAAIQEGVTDLFGRRIGEAQPPFCARLAREPCSVVSRSRQTDL